MMVRREVLRKYFLNQLDLLIKMRDKEDIVYYKGFKLLSIKGDNSKLDFVIDPATYKFNKDAMEYVFNNSKVEKTIEEIYVNRRELVGKYLSLKLKSIILNRANENSFINNKIDNNGNDVHSRIDNIISFIKNEYSQFLVNPIYDDTNEILDKLKIDGKYIIKFSEKTLPNHMLAKLESFVMEKCIFTDNKYDDKTGLSKPSFNYDFEVNNENIYNDFDNFINCRKKTLDDYEVITGFELEKRYQQDLMIKYKNEKIFPFELEYYTLEKDEDGDLYLDDSNKRGRIDCIFLNVDQNKLKDIYMIELKVNEAVVDGTNGINKHFIDIYNLIDNEDNLFKFKQNLLKRLNNMLKLKNENEYFEVKEDTDLKLHFHTIISFASDKDGDETQHKSKVENLLSRLNKLEEIEKMKTRVSNPIPSESKTIYEHLRDLNNHNPKCESSIYYNNVYDYEKGVVSSTFIKKECDMSE